MRLRSLVRCAAIPVFAGLMLVTQNHVAAAQSGVKETTPDSAKALIGTWEGSYSSDHADPGAMMLVIAKDSAIKAMALSIAIGGKTQSVPVHDFVVTTNDISWIQETMGMSCQATAIVKSGQMKGAVVCGHGQITFTLSKRS